jgi:predicted phage terminase large subunit-like protein
LSSNEQLQNLSMKCRDDPLFCGKVWAPLYFPNRFATFQYNLIHRIKNKPDDIWCIVVEIPRGRAKTLIVSSLLTLHDSVYENLKYSVIGSHSDIMAKRIVSDIKNMIKGDRFSTMFPKAKITRDTSFLIEVDDRDDNGFHFQIMSRGRASQVTGMRFEEARIQRYIGDDLEDPEAIYNQELVDKNEGHINEVVRPALAPGGYIILIGTPFSFDCTTQRFSRYPKGVMTIRYPGLVDERMVPGMSERLGIDEGKSIWEDRFPTEVVLRERDEAYANGTSAFNAWMRQVMLDPRPPGAVQFNMEGIRYIKPEDITKKLNVFILCDFAYSRQSWADDSAIVVIGVDDENNYYILHAIKDRWGDVKTTEMLIDLAERFKENLRAVGVETRSFGFVQKRMIEAKKARNLNFSLVELKPGNRAKSERIRAMIPVIDDGRFYMVRGLRKLEDEMYRFKGEELKHGDDLMDALAYIRDIAYKPETVRSKDEISKEENHKIWAGIFKDYEEVRKQAKDESNLRRVHDSHRSIDNYF